MSFFDPKISIVTINYNGASNIEQTIKSVINQKYSNYEYIIVDGASTDNSIAIINKYLPYITKFQSEPDKGIADAMNKGFELSTGDFIVYIHSDDYLLSENSLSQASEYFDNVNKIYAFGIRFGCNENYKKLYPRGFNPWMNFKFGLLHQGVLCHRTVFEEIGRFDTDFKLAMDYDFFLRAYKKGIHLKRCKYTLAFMRNTGVSSNLDNQSLRTRFLEERKAQYNNEPTALLKFLYPIYWKVYPRFRGIGDITK